MPRPASLVVKNGSKARSLDLGGHAAAAVGDRDRDEAVGRAGRRRARRATSSRQPSQRRRAKRSVPPPGIASRALIAMLSSADSSCPGSAQHAQPARRRPRPRCGCAGRACGAACRRANAASRRRRPRPAAAPGGARTRAACRSARRRAATRGWPRRRAAAPWPSSASAGRSPRTCRLPWMTVSRLLKSWAMPPVSWPTLSSRCAWLERLLRLGALQAARQQVGERLEEAHLVVAEVARLRASARRGRRSCGRGPRAARRARCVRPASRYAARHGEARLDRVVGHDDRAPLGEDEAERGVGAVGDRGRRASRRASSRRRRRRAARDRSARAGRPSPRRPASASAATTRHVVEQHLRIARVDREPADLAPAARCSGRAAAPASCAGRRRCRGSRRRRAGGRWSCSGLSAISTIDLAAVLAPGDELGLLAHRPRLRLAREGLAVRGVARPDAVGDERVDLQADELVDA